MKVADYSSTNQEFVAAVLKQLNELEALQRARRHLAEAEAMREAADAANKMAIFRKLKGTDLQSLRAETEKYAKSYDLACKIGNRFEFHPWQSATLGVGSLADWMGSAALANRYLGITFGDLEASGEDFRCAGADLAEAMLAASKKAL